MSGDRLARFQENIDRANESGELVVVIGVDFAQGVLEVAKAARDTVDYIQRLRSRVYVLENTLPENYMETLEAAEAEVRQLREERDALQDRVYALENAFPEDVRDEMEKGRYAVQRAKIAEAEAQRLREGLREIEQAASIYAASKHPEKDAEDLFLDVGVKARALLAASPPDGEGYRERPIEEDFYLDPKGEWVYRWNDERWVLRSPLDKSADFDNCPDEDWGETDGGGAK